jgi:glycosyltransferase involved in cell wall biosynthesis
VARPKLLFLQTEDYTFWSHRMPTVRAAKAAGFDVVVALNVKDHGGKIAAEVLRVVPIPWRRSSLNPFHDLAVFVRVLRLYAAERPDIVHQVTAKPILYGTLAARLCGVPAIVNTMTGLGFVFISNGLKARVLRPLLKAALRLALAAGGSRTVFQNEDDLKLFVGGGLIDEGQAVLIRGSGVDVRRFAPLPEREGIPLVVLPARMLWDKGVKEFVEAARLLKAQGVRARLALVGEGDAHNPAAVPEETLRSWKAEGAVEWWGAREDMGEVYAQAHIVCLPSYREGLPKALLEAGACARPCVANDVPGCREVVRDGETGLLVAPRDAPALARALKQLIEDGEQRRRLGQAGRRRVEAEFSQERVGAAMAALYRGLLER